MVFLQASEIFALRQELSQHAVVLEKLKNECMSSEHAAREACNNDRSKLQSQLEEALREAAVQRVMAEAWQRDLKVAVTCNGPTNRLVEA